MSRDANETTGTSIQVRIVDALGNRVNRGFIGVQYFPVVFRQGGERKNLREIFFDEFDPLGRSGESVTEATADAILNAQAGVNVLNGWGRQFEFDTGGRRSLFVPEPGERELESRVEKVEAVVYAAVVGEHGRVWFGTRYLEDPYDIEEPLDVVVDRVLVDQFEPPADPGTVVSVWRTVSREDPGDQLLVADVHADGGTPRGVVSLAVPEPIPIDFEAMTDTSRALDPFGRWDVWVEQVAFLEKLLAGDEFARDQVTPGQRSDTFREQARRQLARSDDGPSPEAFGDWPFPIMATFVDAVERDDVPEELFEFRADPKLRWEDLPDDEIELALAGLALIVSIPAVVAAAPAASAVVSALAFYYTGLDIASDVLARDVSVEDITGRTEPLDQYDKSTHDRALTGWNPEDSESWVYTNRVPLTLDPGVDREYESSVSGLWSYGSTIKGVDEPFTFRTDPTPGNPPGGGR